MKNLKDLKLDKETEKKVEDWLNGWLQMLINKADGREGEVHRADFENNDFFYFTDCTDILNKDPEARGHEHDRKIQIRKRVIMSQLLLKNLLGTLKLKKIKCSHCGYPERWIQTLGDGFGHFLFCPNCMYTTIGTYPGGYIALAGNICRTLEEKYKDDPKVMASVNGVRKQIELSIQEFKKAMAKKDETPQENVEETKFGKQLQDVVNITKDAEKKTETPKKAPEAKLAENKADYASKRRFPRLLPSSGGPEDYRESVTRLFGDME